MNRIAPGSSSIAADNALHIVAQIGFSSGCTDPLATRYACCALRQLSTPLGTPHLMTQQQQRHVYLALMQVMPAVRLPRRCLASTVIPPALHHTFCGCKCK